MRDVMDLDAPYVNAATAAMVVLYDCDLRLDAIVCTGNLFAWNLPRGPFSRHLWLEQVHADDRSAYDEAVEASVRSGAAFFCEYRRILPGGRVVWVLDRGGMAPLATRPTAPDESAHLCGVLLDVTAYKLTEASLRIQHQALAEALAVLGAAGALDRDRARTLATVAEGGPAGLPDASAIETARNEVTAVLERITDGFVVLDRSLRIAWLNGSAHALMAMRGAKRTREQMLGLTVGEVFHEPDFARIRSRLHDAIELQTPAAFEDYLPQFAVWLEFTVWPAPDGLTVYFRDIGERKAAEMALLAERERMDVTLRSIGEAVVTTDRVGRVVLANPVARSITGLELPTTGTGCALAEVIRLEDEHTGAARPLDLSVVLADRRVEIDTGTVLVDDQGRRRPVTGSMTPTHGPGGEVTGAVLVLQDMTRRRKLEEVATRASKLEAIGSLARSIAHEFNNVFTAIMTNVTLVRLDSRLEAQQVARLDAAETSCLKARELSQQMLTFARGGAPAKATADLAELVRQVITQWEPGPAYAVRCELAPQLWPVDIDAGQVAQAIEALLSNAAQAMPGGGTVTVRLANGDTVAPAGGTSQPRRVVRLQIEDHGAGISSRDQARVFDPFFTTKPNAVGLGLTAAFSIVQRHGGQIDLTSEPGSRTVFTVQLPAAAPPPRAQLSTPSSGLVRASGATARPARILLMDDERDVREVAALALRALGHDVTQAVDGAVATELWQQARATGVPFDVVLVDLTVPNGVGGFEAVRRMRAIDPDVKAIVASGYSDDPVMAEPQAHGFVGVVPKPYGVRDLDRALAAVVGLRAHESPDADS
ncbi:MAG: response regulator [Myxococcales bacterium]|nr:response regulator [Myxococcales bacterium]